MGVTAKGSEGLDETSLRPDFPAVSAQFVRNHRAKRYILRVLPGRVVRITIPRAGTTTEALAFLRRHVAWVRRQLERVVEPARAEWPIGSYIWFRGQPALLTSDPDGCARVGLERIGLAGTEGDLRPRVERWLWGLAWRELPGRVRELAREHGFHPGKISVRNQRTRWGSCSRRRTISLNWRLVQAPELVRDYIILHELAHLRHMNHSRVFWSEVARICPHFQEAESWLRRHPGLIRGACAAPGALAETSTAGI